MFILRLSLRVDVQMISFQGKVDTIYYVNHIAVTSQFHVLLRHLEDADFSTSVSYVLALFIKLC